ncbi:MAG: tRNA 2-thiouridine(34) synthase MnmA [Spirochaetia bacterium]|nr:tRNA 2-thiouridine(34) synthase MnmA [Spirochaetia bacterium]
MKALIAMSGGVDSSVAALLMKEKGYECIGCTMHLYDNEDAGIPKSHTCCSLADVEDARRVAYSLGMDYFVFNFTRDFRKQVIEKFIQCYEDGQTPNPCIDCNRYMKFAKLFERAQILQCGYVVTGHYAQIEYIDGSYLLKKSADESKDQSYVLYMLDQEQLAHISFPLGSMRKSQVREIAAEHGFCNAGKPDSQDICFVPDGDYASIIKKHTGKKPVTGDFLDTKGHVIGKHRGIINYTIGQRRGLGISASEPLYVVSIHPEDNTVVVGHDCDLFSRNVQVRDFNWISGKAPEKEILCKAKIRYRSREQEAVAYPKEDGTVEIVFNQGQRAVTPGQAAVLYDGDVVLGGGVIYA